MRAELGADLSRRAYRSHFSAVFPLQRRRWDIGEEMKLIAPAMRNMVIMDKMIDLHAEHDPVATSRAFRLAQLGALEEGTAKTNAEAECLLARAGARRFSVFSRKGRPICALSSLARPRA